jgi:aryl-alcohol dehydrogenase-like predicted oxidoreductase
MKKRTSFGKTGLAVSALGFGGGPIGYLDTEQQRVDRVLNLLLDEGVNLIDTAACYHESESMIGRAVASRRGEFVLVSKCGHKVNGLSGEEWSGALIARTVDRALQRLNTDHLDVMLLHSCDLPVLKRGEAVAALAQARQAGKVRFIGYSGDNEEAAFAAGLPDIDVIEMSVNLCDQANLDAVLPKARERKLGVIAKRPIANAAWKQSQPGIYSGYARPYADRLMQMGLRPADLGFDGDPQLTWPALALRFTLSLPDVHVAITGTTNPDNARANVQAAELGPLPAAVVAKIRDAFRSTAAKSTSPWKALS